MMTLEKAREVARASKEIEILAGILKEERNEYERMMFGSSDSFTMTKRVGMLQGWDTVIRRMTDLVLIAQEQMKESGSKLY